MGGQAGRYPDQEALHGRIVLPTATFLLTPTLKFPMNWIHILLYIPHCRFGVSASARKVIAKSLPNRNLLYNASFYLSHFDLSLFLKAKSPNSSYAVFLALVSTFLSLTHLIGTAQVALLTSLPCLVTVFNPPFVSLSY